jgi:hypothetical protein
VVSLIFYQYREVSIGGYDEVTITIVCFPESYQTPHGHLHDAALKHVYDGPLDGVEYPGNEHTQRRRPPLVLGFPPARRPAKRVIRPARMIIPSIFS